MFWIWILVATLVIVGVSVVVGKAVSRQPTDPMTRQERMTALKASGALKYRKSNRD
jgi:hypothetical protein